MVAAQSAAVALHLQPAADPMALSGAPALQLEDGWRMLLTQTATLVSVLQYQPVIAPLRVADAPTLSGGARGFTLRSEPDL